jgi:hypothetical protein
VAASGLCLWCSSRWGLTSSMLLHEQPLLGGFQAHIGQASTVHPCISRYRAKLPGSRLAYTLQHCHHSFHLTSRPGLIMFTIGCRPSFRFSTEN